MSKPLYMQVSDLQHKLNQEYEHHRALVKDGENILDSPLAGEVCPSLYWLCEPVQEGQMQRINGYPIYSLGSALGQLTERIVDGVKVSDVYYYLFSARWYLNLLVNNTIVPLRLSSDAAASVVKHLDPLMSEESRKDINRTIEPVTRYGIGNAIQTFEAVLSAELARLNLYHVSAKRAWDMDILIETAEAVLSPAALALMDAQIATDVREAGRCIAFSLPTAAGFHTFRLVEAYVLKYFPVLKIDPPKENNRNLGTYIKLLSENGVDEKITSMLMHLKDSYRNPIMHPEITLSQEEAENLFGFAQSVIGAMANNINAIAQGKQLALAPVKAQVAKT